MNGLKVHTDINHKQWRKRVYVIANKGFGLEDGTGPAEESKRTKRVQGWSRQIGLGALFAIHTKFFSR